MHGMDRALSFGSDALAYDRHRPGYPDSGITLHLARHIDHQTEHEGA